MILIVFVCLSVITAHGAMVGLASAQSSQETKQASIPNRASTDPAHLGSDTADLQAVADRLERTIAEADPRQAKALLRLLIKDLRVNGRSEILPTYRVVTPEVCALPSSVGGTGLEPVTPSLSSWC